MNVGIQPVMTDRGIYIHDNYSIRFPCNSYQDFPVACTDVVVSVLFYPKLNRSFCLFHLNTLTSGIQVCFSSNSNNIRIEIKSDTNYTQERNDLFNGWKLYTIRFYQDVDSTILYVYIDGNIRNNSLILKLNSLSFVSTNTYWEIGGVNENIEGFLYQIWWHCQVTTSINILSSNMISYPSGSCITIYAMTPYKKCLSDQPDQYKNSENEACSCPSYQSCNNDQECISSCQYPCLSSSTCRSALSPKCSGINPSYCLAIPDTDICYSCSPGWRLTPPGVCKITVPACKTFNSSGECTECEPFYYKFTSTSTVCLSCAPDCPLCSINSSGAVICNICSVGYFIQPDGYSCLTTCPYNYYGNTVTIPHRCLPCQTNCKICSYRISISYSVCSECNSGYYLRPNLNSLDATQSNISQCIALCPGYYYNDNTPPASCKLCRTNCMTCTNNTDCSRCGWGYYSSGGTDITCLPCSISWCAVCLDTTACITCHGGSWLDTSTKNCRKCLPNCLTCSSDTNCTRCSLFYTLLNIPGVTVCALFCNHVNYDKRIALSCGDMYSASRATYCTAQSSTSLVTCQNCLLDDLQSGNCPVITCPENCIKCESIGDQVECLICSVNTFRQPGNLRCLNTCPDFYYKDTINRTCNSCISNCKSCQSDITGCQECGNDYSLLKDSSACVQTCPERFYSDRVTIWRCNGCIPNCSICTSSTDCQRCIDNMYLVTDIFGNKNCQNSCPTRSYHDNNRVCYNCMKGCDVCSSASECSICSVGYLYKNGLCVPLVCDPNCERCVISSTELRCDLCIEGYFVQVADYMCGTDCIRSYYPDNTTKRCEKCMDNCDICEKLSSNLLTCNECRSGYILTTLDVVNLCELAICPESCSSCNITSSSVICTACKDSFYMLTTSTVACVPICPPKYYLETSLTIKSCLSCPSNCDICTSSLSCTQCSANYYLQPMDATLCDTICPIGYYPNNSTPAQCSPCHLNCLDCTESVCLKCRDLYTPNPIPISELDACIACPSNCILCSYLNNSLYCLHCDEEYFLQPEEMNIRCDSSCPEGYYMDISSRICIQCNLGEYSAGTECIKCEKLCRRCIGEGLCIECIENALAIDGRCKCEDYYQAVGGQCVGGRMGASLRFEEDKLMITFEYDLKTMLDLNYMLIYIDSIECLSTDFSLKSVNLSTYSISSSLFYSNPNKILTLIFIYSTSIIDIYNQTLETGYYYISIPPNITPQNYFNNTDTSDNSNHSNNPDTSDNSNNSDTSDNSNTSDASNDSDTSNTLESLTDRHQIRLQQTKAMESSTRSTVTGSLAASLFISVLKLNLNSIWAILNSIQVLAYIPLLNVELPSRTLGVCKAFSSFNIIPNLLEYILDKAGPSIDKRYTEIGIDTNQFLLNTGHNIVVLSILLILYSSLKFINLVTNKLNEYRIIKILRKLQISMEWNGFLRFYIEAYLDFVLYPMLNLYYISLDTSEQIAELVVSIFSLILALISPCFLVNFLLRNSAKLKEPSFNIKFNSLYEGLNISDNTVILNSIFMIRRFLYSAILIFLGYSTHTQIVLSAMTSYSTFCYILYNKPYDCKKANMLNCFSEGCTFLVICLLYAYAFDIEEKTAENLDWVIVFLLYISFLAPLAVNLIESVKRLMIWVSRCMRIRLSHMVNNTRVTVNEFQK